MTRFGQVSDKEMRQLLKDQVDQALDEFWNMPGLKRNWALFALQDKLAAFLIEHWRDKDSLNPMPDMTKFL